MFFDPLYLIFLSPALVLMLWAQWRVKSAYTQGMRLPCRYTGAQAARQVLDQAGLTQVGIEEIPGELSDHYDPRDKVLRLSTAVYRSNSLAAVGIAAHEAGHALQDAYGYMPLVIRNAAVPAARFGPTLSIILLIIGASMHSAPLVFFGLLAFGGLVFFQLVNLPVEFDASTRAKQMLGQLDIVSPDQAYVVSDVLNAAAWTYVAATLQSILTLLYYVFRFSGIFRSDRDR